MWIYDEKRLALVEKMLRLPVLGAMMAVGQIWLPFLFYSVTGPSSSQPGTLFLTRILVAAMILSASMLADVCAEKIQHAITRLFARLVLLVLAVPAGVFAGLFWPLLLVVIVLLSVCGVGMGVMK